MSSPSTRHVPVMLDEIVALLAPALHPMGEPPPRPPVFVDATLGLAGHAEALLEACPQAHLIGLDRDPRALALARERLARYGERVRLVETVYDQLAEVLAELDCTHVQGVLLDLGLSSLQIDERERGFAYAVDSPLDMRMGATGATAADILNTYSAEDLTRILRTYGEERFADRIARRIVSAREDRPFDTSARLVELVDGAIPAAAKRTGGHPAKRTFQALRIEVNTELDALDSVLPQAVAALAVGGRIAVLAYHSLEDRLVKQVLAAGARDTAPAGLPVVPPEHQPRLRLLTRGAERPGEAEVARNRRAASARLRLIPGVGVWTVAETLQRAIGHPDAVSVGDYHLPNMVVHLLTGRARGTDEEMLELLAPWVGHRQRVMRLIEAAGVAAPRYGPRFAYTDIRTL